MSRILAITHTPTHPPTSGNRVRINSLLRVLQDAGHDVCLFLLDVGNGDKAAMARQWSDFWAVPYNLPNKSITRRVREFVSSRLHVDWYMPYGVDDWYRDSLDQKFYDLERGDPFDVVLVEYVFLSKALECFPSALKILDTHDIFSDRHKLFLKHGKKPSWFYTVAAEEAKGLGRADVVLAIQEHEKATFSALLPNKNILCVGHNVEIIPPDATKPFFNRLFFVGSGNDVNFHALSWFLIGVWPALRRKFPELELNIAGSICSRMKQFPKGCQPIGEVENLAECYKRVDIVVNPVQFGTGLKIKNLEALGFGMPLITTAVGAEGIEEGAGRAYRVAKDQDEFVQEIGSLLENSSARKVLSDEGVNFAGHYNSRAVSALLDFLQSYRTKAFKY